MMSYFEGLKFFVFLSFLLIGALLNRRFNFAIKPYALFSSAIVMIFIYGEKPAQFLNLLIYLLWQWLLVWIYLNNFKQKNEKNYLVFIFLSLIPLFSVKMGEITHYSPFGFLGISYMSFKTVQMIIEINDGLIDTVKFSDFILFMIYFPTISSGPITRSRDFEKNINSEITKEEYKDYLGDGLLYLLSGLVYKIVISHYLYGVLGTVQGGFLIRNLKYMYLYGLYMFFDFCGYSYMVYGTSLIYGIKIPLNFKRPFLSVDIKDFWNRWHISLSHWFRDFVFSRFVKYEIKKKVLKNLTLIACIGYIANMLLMGVWHGLNLSFILYGLYHGILLALTELFQKTGFYKKNKKKRAYKLVSGFITFNLVMFGFYIFSGRFLKELLIIIK